MSNRDAAVAINSIAQHASPIGIGQSEFLRTQLSAASRRVKITLPSILESYAPARVSAIAIKLGLRWVGATEKRATDCPGLDCFCRGGFRSERNYARCAGYAVCAKRYARVL